MSAHTTPLFYEDTPSDDQSSEVEPPRCESCQNYYHPATGSVLLEHGTTPGREHEPVVLCGPCTRHFTGWLHGHMKRKWGKVSFYDAALTSNRPE